MATTTTGIRCHDSLGRPVSTRAGAAIVLEFLHYCRPSRARARRVPVRVDPRDVDVEQDEHVRVREERVVAPEGEPEEVRVRPRHADGGRARRVHAEREERRELREQRHRARVAPRVRGDDERELRGEQRVDDRGERCAAAAER